MSNNLTLTQKWNMQLLTRDDVKQWIKANIDKKDKVDTEDLQHLTRLMHNIYLAYHHKHDLGHFLSYVVENKFIEAVCQADDTNLKHIKLYAWFLYNVAPMDYKIRILS